MVRYIEQVRCSWGYHWGLFREIWDMFTLRGWQWLVVGLLVVLCMLPTVVGIITYPLMSYYTTTPVPPFDPSLSQDIITDYYWVVREKPPFLLVLNHSWVASSGYKSLVNVLCLVSAGLLLVAYLRGK